MNRQPIELSIVVPAYNEAARLPPHLRDVRRHFDEALPGVYEVVVVDDGSRDGMNDVLRGEFADWAALRTVSHAVNRGKGAAVRTGVLAARGELVLFADADGATPIEEERKLRAAIDHGADVAIGSRLIESGTDGRSVQRPAHRALAGRTFAVLARRMFRLSVLDVQCGFKMFRRDAARRLFEPCRVEGYVFDVAVLAAANRLGYRTAEVAIRWTEQPGSKLRPFSGPCKMACELVKLRWSLRTWCRRASVIAAAEGLSPGP